MKKRIKHILFFNSLALISSPIFLSISCNKNNTNEQQINFLKTTLNNFINENQSSLSSANVKLWQQDNSNVNLFNSLLDYSLISNYFTFNGNLQIDKTNRYSLVFEFNYNVLDSFGNSFYPRLSNDKKSITIPILIWLFDNENNINVCKYIDIFTLKIEPGVVNNFDNPQYNDLPGKKITFQNSSFETIPNEMIDKYLDFILLITTKDYKKGPIYQYNHQDLLEWKGKTLSDVKLITDAFTAPTSYYDSKNIYDYSIVKSYFYDKEREYATFIMKIALNTSPFSNLINDAKNIFELTFEHEYSIVIKDWKFALPTASDINEYVSNNKNLLNSIKSEIETNVLLYTPKLIISPDLVKEQGVEWLINRFKRGVKDFLPPNHFVYTFSDGQQRMISFSISSLENSSEADVVIIHLNLIIDKDDLSTSLEYSKKFNIKSCKFV